MAFLGGIELERGIDGQCAAELIAALALAARGAVNKCEMLVGVGALLGTEGFAQCALEILRRFIVVAGFVLLQRELEGRGGGFHLDENRAPRRVAGFRRSELEIRIQGEGPAKLFATQALAAGGAMDERKVLVRPRTFAIGQPEVDRRLQVAAGFGVVAVFVLAQARAQHTGSLAGLEEPAQRRRGACGEREHGDERGSANRHLNRWRIFTASPAFTCTFSTCTGKVELRISTVCAPAGRSSTRSGGLTPRLRPSTSTSPQGATASSRRPPPPAGACFSPRCSNFFSTRANTFFEGPSPLDGVAGAAGAGVAAPGARRLSTACVGSAEGSINERAATPPATMARDAPPGTTHARRPEPGGGAPPPATMARNATPATTNAERRKPRGPERASQPGAASPSRVWFTVSPRRREDGVPPTTE